MARGKWIASEQDRRSQNRIVSWSVLWVGVFVLADTVIERGSIEGDVAVTVAAIAVSVLGVGWIRSYVRFLRDADELARKVHLDAMAVGLGAGFVTGFGLLLLDQGGVVSAGPHLLLAAMVLAYAVAVVVGWRRFS